MGACAISNLNLTICEKKMTPSMVKYKAVMYINTPDLRLLHRKSIYHGVAKHVLWVPGWHGSSKGLTKRMFPSVPKTEGGYCNLTEEIKICGGGEMFDNRFKRIQNSTLF